MAYRPNNIFVPLHVRVYVYTYNENISQYYMDF